MEGKKKERQCDGYCLKQKKEKCSEATSPLPMSHATLSPLVEEARGRVTAPGQSAASMQILSGELCWLKGWDGTEWGRGDEREQTRRPHLEQPERRSTGFACRDRGVLEVEVNSRAGMHSL